MQYGFERSFKKDFEKLKDKDLAQSILSSINDVELADNIEDIKNIKKLKGYKNVYRIRCGNFRIGIVIDNDIVIFTAFAHRKDIYKKFP